MAYRIILKQNNVLFTGWNGRFFGKYLAYFFVRNSISNREGNMRYTFALLLLFIPLAFGQSHVLLSEVCVRNSAGEFIEIYNPTNSTVTIENYYLTDLYGKLETADDFYPVIVSGPVQNQQTSDFLVQFPAGTTIDPGEAIIIAMSGSGFLATYTFEPDYEIMDTGTGILMSVPANGFVGTSAGLSNGGETVTLFHWDSYSDLVQDVDYASWSDDGVRRVDKTGIAFDGPDSGTTETTYLDDTPALDQDRISGGPHPNGESFTRVDYAEGTETFSGGNGLYGHDETSENLSITWEFAIASPGDVTTAISHSTWAKIKLLDF